MPKIFISYRRVDSQDFTDRLYDYMVRHFGVENVFQDVGDNTKIPLGVDFVEYLAEQVRRCDVLLVVIGEQWTRLIQERAERDDDFVRIEIESAFAQKKLVIPVLKSATAMPASADLPASIRPLARRNASRVRPNPDFVKDCDTLAEGIRTVFNQTAPAPAPTRPRVIDLLPQPFAWVEIPAGKVTLGGNNGANGGYINKAQTFDVPVFAIAKYPVTNAQFAPFIEAGGYKDKAWWTEAGWEAKLKGWNWDGKNWVETNNPWMQPRYWTDSKWNGADYPVVGVSWYEAVAFCRWLSERTGEAVTLPTDQQWQCAAQGDTGWAYPWGDKWDRDRCNNNVDGKGVGKTTPVSQYEKSGASPFGVVDMSGNVWEWCLTEYETGQVSVDGTNVRVLRGGSWYVNSAVYFRADYRGGYYPHYWLFNFGLRLALSYK